MEREPSSASVPRIDVTSSRTSPLDWAQRAGKTETVARAIEDYVRHRRQRRMSMVAAGVVVVAIAIVGWRGMGAKRDLASVGPVASAIVSRPQQQTLPDGTVVDLKLGAELGVEFTRASPGPRRVTLRRGEAHFSVTKNPQRPFVVVVGDVEVRAVGTAFAVQRGATEVEVLVTEGRVAVDQPGAVAAAATASANGAAAAPGASPPLALVDAGNRAVVATDRPATEARVQAVSAAELDERLSWRVPRLEFNATPLVDVVALFNRHAKPSPDGPTASLVLAEPELQTLPLSGTLRADNIPVLLQILASSYGIAAEHRPGGEIVLRRAP